MGYHRGGPAKLEVFATWADYKKAGPLLFSLDHRGTRNGDPLNLFFSNVAVKLAGVEHLDGRAISGEFKLGGPAITFAPGALGGGKYRLVGRGWRRPAFLLPLAPLFLEYAGLQRRFLGEQLFEFLRCHCCLPACCHAIQAASPPVRSKALTTY
jgi:hypothetical protein